MRRLALCALALLILAALNGCGRHYAFSASYHDGWGHGSRHSVSASKQRGHHHGRHHHGHHHHGGWHDRGDDDCD
jgi:hypothetical protein